MHLEPATHDPGDTFATAIPAPRIEKFGTTVLTAGMVRTPDTLLRIWDELLLTPHLRDQAIARMARKPILIGLPNPSSCLALRLRGESGFGIGVMNFTRGTEPHIMLFPKVKSAPS